MCEPPDPQNIVSSTTERKEDGRPKFQKSLRDIFATDRTLLCAVSLQANASKGRYMVVSRDFDAGETVFTEDPVVWTPTNDEEFACDWCTMVHSLGGDDVCSRFRKYEAAMGILLKKLPELAKQNDLSSRDLKLIVKLIFILKSTSPKSEKWSIFDLYPGLDIQSPTKENLARKKVAEVILDNVPNEYASVLSRDDIIHTFGAVASNGFHTTCHMSGKDDITHTRGEVLYLRAAMMEHSCRPNCCIVFDDFSVIEVRALRRIEYGEAVSICYSGTPYMTTNQRRLKLSERYGFVCQCELCTERPELCRGFICPKCSTGLVCSQGTGSVWKCQSPSPDCNYVFSDDEKMASIELEKELEEDFNLEEMKLKLLNGELPHPSLHYSHHLLFNSVLKDVEQSMPKNFELFEDCEQGIGELIARFSANEALLMWLYLNRCVSLVCSQEMQMEFQYQLAHLFQYLGFRKGAKMLYDDVYEISVDLYGEFVIPTLGLDVARYEIEVKKVSDSVHLKTNFQSGIWKTDFIEK